jgi:hypothetical protein
VPHRDINIEKAALRHLKGEAELSARLGVLKEALLIMRVNVHSKASRAPREAERQQCHEHARATEQRHLKLW